MTRKQFEQMTFEEVINYLESEGQNITTYDTLKDFAIEKINEDNLFLAIHILEAINNEYADYYSYDYCMGTQEEPTAIATKEDLEDFIDFD